MRMLGGFRYRRLVRWFRSILLTHQNPVSCLHLFFFSLGILPRYLPLFMFSFLGVASFPYFLLWLILVSLLYAQ